MMQRQFSFVLVAVMAAAAVVVGAAGVGIVVQFTCQEGFHSIIGIAVNTAVEIDACLVQSSTGAAADAAADQGVNLVGGQVASQCTVAGTGDAEDLSVDDGTVLDLVELELGGVAEVGEDLFVLISNSDKHDNFSLVHKVKLLYHALWRLYRRKSLIFQFVATETKKISSSKCHIF